MRECACVVCVLRASSQQLSEVCSLHIALTAYPWCFRPLENLKSCLSGLHSEISTLQHQMDEHKNALKK